MTDERTITITLPEVTPETAYVLSDLAFKLAHEIDLHYGDLIRSYLQARERELGERQEEFPF